MFVRFVVRDNHRSHADLAFELSSHPGARRRRLLAGDGRVEAPRGGDEPFPVKMRIRPTIPQASSTIKRLSGRRDRTAPRISISLRKRQYPKRMECCSSVHSSVRSRLPQTPTYGTGDDERGGRMFTAVVWGLARLAFQQTGAILSLPPTPCAMMRARPQERRERALKPARAAPRSSIPTTATK
jgi:hypothetical protein